MRRTRAAAQLVAAITARTRVETGEQHEARRIGDRGCAARDSDRGALQRLPQYLERRTRELRQFIEERGFKTGFTEGTPRERRPSCLSSPPSPTPVFPRSWNAKATPIVAPPLNARRPASKTSWPSTAWSARTAGLSPSRSRHARPSSERRSKKCLQHCQDCA